MAYYLTMEKKKGEYSPLDITKSKYYSRISNLKGNGSTLYEVDVFTMMFNDEYELRNSLLEEHLIDTNNLNKPLSIRRLINGKYKKVTYDFLYQSDMELVMEPKFIINKINDKLYSGDYRFVSQLANDYLEYYECSSTAPEVRNAAIQSSMNGIISKEFNVYDNNGDNILTRMVKLLIYEYDQAKDGNITYLDKVKYRNIHSLVAFINNYQKKYNDEETSQMSLFNEIDKPKKLVRRKQIDGQISLFD